MAVALTDREQIIDDVYSNPRYGYGSIKETTEQAKKKDPTITFTEVRKYLSKLDSRQINYTSKGQNSFISKHKLYEIQMDLVDMGEKATTKQGYRYALIGIDAFTKVAWGAPTKEKKTEHLIPAFKEIINKIGVPTYIYTDREGALEKKEFVKILNEYKIKHLISASGAPMVERFNRTLKEGIFKRINALGQDKTHWIDYFETVINKYNNTDHHTIGMKPNEARLNDNFFTVKWNLISHAKRNRTYEPLEIGDNVRVMETKDYKKKGTDPKYSKDVYKVIGKQHGLYLVNNNKRKPYLRHELLLLPKD